MRRYTMLEPATARIIWSLSDRSAEIISVAPGTGRALRATSLNGCFRAERSLTTSLAITPPAPRMVIICDVPVCRRSAGLPTLSAQYCNADDRVCLHQRAVRPFPRDGLLGNDPVPITHP